MNQPEIIFICYVNRSGSTFLANLFSKSEKICVCPEADILVNLFLEDPEKICSLRTIHQLEKSLKTDLKLKNWNLRAMDPDSFLTGMSHFQCFKNILGQYKKHIKPKSQVIVFKSERLIYLYDLFNKINQDFNIAWVTIIRDCRAVYNSQKSTKFPATGKSMSKHPVNTALYWNSFIHRCYKYLNKDNFIVVHFEKLIANLSNEFSIMLDKLNISEFDIKNTPGDLWQRMPESHRAIHRNILQLPISSVSNNWEKSLSPEDIFYLQNLSGKYLVDLGYQLIPVASHLKMIRYITIFLLKWNYYLNEDLKKVIFHFRKWFGSKLNFIN